MTLVVVILIGVVVLVYTILMQILAFSWIALPNQTGTIDPKRIQDVKASLIIACRNEEENLPALFASINRQKVRHEQLEVIFVDDHSNDKTFDLLKEFQETCDFSVHVIRAEESEGKKAAITKGVSIASNPLLLFTDADCRFGTLWVAAHMNNYLDGNEFTSGPVMFNEAKNFWQRLMQLEFLGLIASGGAGVKLKWNWMANAANMSVDRNSYLKAMDNAKGHNKASGDDSYLLAALTKKRAEIGFLKASEALVVTGYEPNLKSFVNQRLRWASKGAGYMKLMPLLATMIIFVTNVSIFLSPFIFLADRTLAIITIAVIKVLVDIWFYSFALTFFDKRNLLGLVPIAQIFHIPYVVFTAIFGAMFKYEWKGRKTR